MAPDKRTLHTHIHAYIYTHAWIHNIAVCWYSAIWSNTVGGGFSWQWYHHARLKQREKFSVEKKQKIHVKTYHEIENNQHLSRTYFLATAATMTILYFPVSTETEVECSGGYKCIHRLGPKQARSCRGLTLDAKNTVWLRLDLGERDKKHSKLNSQVWPFSSPVFNYSSFFLSTKLQYSAFRYFDISDNL